MVQTIVFLIAATVLLLSLVLDLAYGFLDPRIRLSSMKARSG
jgi:ABC-type dipeptide/oligopeptide/nickel transport system permease component